MIFVTVGAQMPFDRLVRAVDDWAGRRGRRDVFAQVGPTSYSPANIPFAKFLAPPDFDRKVREASVIVAHAGMGSILTALEVGKPILIMPRRGDLKETRNDHQVATARRFQGRTAVAFDEAELARRLDEIDSLSAASRISSRASEMLAQSLLGFVERGKLPCAEFRGFDGVVCFGSERDEPELLAMMRHLSARVPVLYLTPTSDRPGAILGRIGHALRALVGIGGASGIGTDLWTHPLYCGGADSPGGQKYAAARVRALTRSLGFRHPLIWISRAVAPGIIDRIPHAALVGCGAAEETVATALGDEADVVVRSACASDPAAGVERVLVDLARRGIRVAGSGFRPLVSRHPSQDLLAPLSPANADLPNWTVPPGATEVSHEVAT